MRIVANQGKVQGGMGRDRGEKWRGMVEVKELVNLLFDNVVHKFENHIPQKYCHLNRSNILNVNCQKQEN